MRGPVAPTRRIPVASFPFNAADVGSPLSSRFIEGLQWALQNSFAQLLAGFEVRNVLARDAYRFPGAWISSASRLVIHQIETTKSPDFYAFTRRQAIAQYVHQAFDRDINIFGGQIALVFRQCLDEV